MRIPAIAAVDLALVLLFVLIGQLQHDEPITVLGYADAAWTFVAGLAVGWALTYVLAAVRGQEPGHAPGFLPRRIVPAGLIIWVSTVAFGMVARGLITDRGVQVSFVIVATVVLGLFLLGWRAIARFELARRARAARAVEAADAAEVG